jgi:hypothetical protein
VRQRSYRPSAPALEAEPGSAGSSVAPPLQRLIRLERTFDVELVASIMRHPRLYPHIADDFYPPAEEFVPASGPAIVHLLAYEGDELLGVVITHPINAVCWEIHHALLPHAWGERAHLIGVVFEEWLWKNTLAQTGVGFTAECNRLALRFARRHGMRAVGRLPNAYRKGGKLFDLIVFAKNRP